MVDTDDWEIYQKVIGGPSQGRVLGLGDEVKLKDYNSPNQTCNKPTCLEHKEDYERVKGQVEYLTDKLDKLTQIVQSLLPNTSDNSKARNSHYVVLFLFFKYFYMLLFTACFRFYLFCILTSLFFFYNRTILQQIQVHTMIKMELMKMVQTLMRTFISIYC